VENDALTEFSVLRPLVGMNKLEVERLAKKIGTFDTSAGTASCCSAPPRRPRTRARLEEVRRAERKLSIEDMVRRDIEGVKIILI
jgi:thiamine biosynthesis protein ThiI